MTDIPKLKLLFIIVDRNKGELFASFLSDFEINAEVYLTGRGTVKPGSDIIADSGTPKSVVAAAVREDKIESVLRYIEEKFKTIRNGKGVAFTVPMSAIMGASVYQFLSNTPNAEA